MIDVRDKMNEGSFHLPLPEPGQMLRYHDDGIFLVDSDMIHDRLREIGEAIEYDGEDMVTMKQEDFAYLGFAALYCAMLVGCLESTAYEYEMEEEDCDE